MTKQEVQQEALTRAQGNGSVRNYGAIFAGFAEMGIPESDILPRENVLTYHAWQALGRQVKKGQHGVQITTWIPVSKKVTDPETGEEKKDTFRRPKLATVFHISQTQV